MSESYQLDAADISGPLDVQVDGACRFVGRNMKVAAFKGLGRVDRPQFDMTAVFEAVVNAVAHRDYSIHGSKIRLRLFANRLEIYSPGEIPNTLEPENLLHIQSSRNEVVSSLLAKCPVPTGVPRLATDRKTLMDKRGEGMCIIVENSLEVSGRRPDYGMIGASEFLVTMYGPSEREGEFSAVVRMNALTCPVGLAPDTSAVVPGYRAQLTTVFPRNKSRRRAVGHPRRSPPTGYHPGRQ